MNFFDKYKAGLAIGGRDESMQKALELLLERKSTQGIIVETGCQRLKDDWGAGCSTTIFGDFCKNYNFHLFSVDIDHEALEVAKNVIKDASIPPELVTFVENDSVAFLKDFNQTIDLLYLDSLDAHEYDGSESLYVIQSQLHQGRELEAAWDKLSDNPIILLDDNIVNADYPNGGKTRLTKIFLREHGFKEVTGGKQSLWIK